MITFVPFPFPHAQVTAFFSLIILVLFPCLFVSFVGNPQFAYAMNFTTVLCFVGIHEVARELENPYFTVPNDLPLNNFQAQFNEALVIMYAGFHPDAYREQKDEVVVVETVHEAQPQSMECKEQKEDVDELEVEDLFQPHTEQPEHDHERHSRGAPSSLHLSDYFEEEEKIEEC
jgi:hypothetical protein